MSIGEVWVANNYNNVIEIGGQSGGLLRILSLGSSGDPGGISSDGKHVCILNSDIDSDVMIEVSPESGAIVRQISIPDATGDSTGPIYSDGSLLWFGMETTGAGEVNVNSGRLVQVVGGFIGASAFLTIGQYIWIVDSDLGILVKVDIASGNFIYDIG